MFVCDETNLCYLLDDLINKLEVEKFLTLAELKL